MLALSATILLYFIGWLASRPLAGGSQPALPVELEFPVLALASLLAAGAILSDAQQARRYLQRLLLVAASTFFTLTYVLHWPALFRVADELARESVLPASGARYLFLTFCVLAPMALAYAAPLAVSLRTR